MRLLNRLFASNEGATAIEYGLIAALVSVAMISGYGALTGNLTNVLNAIDTAVTTAGK